MKYKIIILLVWVLSNLNAQTTKELQDKIGTGLSYTQQTVNYFGAKGDGTTDDYTVLQSIINTQNDIVLKPNSTYIISAQLVIDNNTHIYGNNATIKVISGSFTPILISGDSSVVIEGLNIRHNSNAANYALYSNPLSYDDGCGISIKSGSKNITIKDCKIYGHLNSGIIVHSSSNIKILNNTISEGVAVYNIGGDINFYSRVDNSIISGNNCHSNVSSGIEVALSDYCDNVIVSNNICKPLVSRVNNVTRNGIMYGYVIAPAGHSSGSITDNVVEGYGSSGIYVSYIDILVSGNHINNVGLNAINGSTLKGGIILNVPKRAIITNNIIKNVYDAGSETGDSAFIAGIMLERAAIYPADYISSDMFDSDIKISNNVIDSVSGNGFSQYYMPANFTFSSNTITNCKAWDVLMSHDYNETHERYAKFSDNKFITSGKGCIRYIANSIAVSRKKYFDFNNNTFISKLSTKYAVSLEWQGLADSSTFKFNGGSVDGYRRFIAAQYQFSKNINNLTVKNISFRNINDGIFNNNVSSATDNLVMFENCSYTNCNYLFYSDYNNIAGVGYWTGRTKTMYANSSVLDSYNGLLMNTVPSFGTWAIGDKIINLNPSINVDEWICTTAGNPSTAIFFAKTPVDTQQIADNIRNSISTTTANNGYYKIGSIISSTTLTASSPEFITTYGAVIITLPNPSTCYNVTTETGKRFVFRKQESLTMLEIKYNGVTLASADYITTISFIATANGWIQI